MTLQPCLGVGAFLCVEIVFASVVWRFTRDPTGRVLVVAGSGPGHPGLEQAPACNVELIERATNNGEGSARLRGPFIPCRPNSRTARTTAPIFYRPTQRPEPAKGLMCQRHLESHSQACAPSPVARHYVVPSASQAEPAQPPRRRHSPLGSEKPYRMNGAA